ncbi:MAG: ubiquinone-binding protein [Gammaproteobacteria bacterium]|nr:MAG: ubiquinone-binding protein [Gammaproteobacteria bacterium]
MRLFRRAIIAYIFIVAHIIKTQSSPYSAEQMFDLVANFEHYPDFLPFCSKACSRFVGNNQVHGTLFIHKGPFKKAFTTHNTMYRDAEPAYIDIKLVNGPFKTLYGEWRFMDNAQGGSQVTLDLCYDMKSGFLTGALSSVFEWIAKAMVESFCREAHKVYS